MPQARSITGDRNTLAKIFVPLLLAAGLFLSANSSHSQNTSTPAANAHQVEVEGELQVLVEDYAKTSRTRHFLKTSKGPIELHFKGKPTQLSSGTKIHAKGVQTGNILELSTSGTSSLTVTAPATLPNTVGEQKTLVLLVNFQDNTTQPLALSDVTNLVFTQTNNFYKEDSYQQTWITGAGYGWLTMPIATTCDLNQISIYAKQVATAAGISLSGYSHYIYFVPFNSTCGWSGVGTVGGTPGEIAINGRLEVKGVGHELGHNLGLYHSHALECGTTVIGSACTNYEYGDIADIMGNTDTGHFNAFQKERLGWLNTSAMPPITTVQTSGTYTLDPYESVGTNPKALKILKSIDSTTGAHTWYYVEYRATLGFDGYLASMYSGNFTSGVVIHTGSDSDPNTSNLLDMTPSSNLYFDWNDPALTVGQSYTDTAAGVTIATSWVNGSNAGISVTLGQSTTNCVRANPVLSPATQSQSSSAGTTLTYGVTLTNMDSTGCGTSSFALKATPPSGWSGSIASPTLSIAPGASASTTLSVTSPTTATGSNSVGLGASNGAATSYAGSATATYQVGSTLQATVTTDKTSYAAGQTVKMTSVVTSGGAAVSGATVTFTVTQPNGAATSQIVTTSSSGVATASYKIARKNATGSYKLNAYASGSSLTASSATSFTVQ